MSGYQTLIKIKRIEQEANELGFQLGHPKNGYYKDHWGDVVAAYPLDNKFPMYSRDAELFLGTLEDLLVWMDGVKWARQYDEMMRVSTPAKRERKEQDERNRQMVARLKDEELELKK